MKIRALLAIVATAALLSAGARSAAAPELVPYRTLVTTRAPIVSFAQDGDELAWVERPAGKRCRRILHLRSLRYRHETTARIGCGGYDDLALAGTRVLWKRLAAFANLTRDVDVMTVAAGERRARTVERVHVELDPLDCHYLDRTCRPEREPGLAGGSGVLAYATPAGVRRVVNGVHGSLSRFPAAAALTVADGRVLAFRSELRPGDGCGCASSPAWLPDGSIEYLSHIGLPSDLNGELTRISADGSGRQRLTNDRRFRLTLDVSADGTKVAYGYVDLADSRRLIAVANADGSGAHDLGPGGDPAWSPDGSRLAFELGAVGSRQIYLMDPDGANVVQLTHGAESTQPSWSPDGTRIAYAVSGGISVMNGDGSDAHALGLVGSQPDWSPDAGRLVFVGGAGLSVAGADGSGAQLLGAVGAAPRWSPDGSSIVFQREAPWWDVQSRSELYVVRPDGRGLRPLTFSVESGWASPVEVRDDAGRLVSRFEVPGMAYDAALGTRMSALAQVAAPGHASIELFETRTGVRYTTLVLAARSIADLVGIAGRWLVFHVDRTIGGVELRGARTKTFALLRKPIGLSLSGNRLAWAENVQGHGRIIALTVPR